MLTGNAGGPDRVHWTRRWPFRIARALAIGMAVPFLILAVVTMGFADSFIFHPTKHPEGGWEHRVHASVPVDEIAYEASDGTKLVGWHSRPANPRCTFLFFHGNAGNVSDRLHVLEILAGRNIAVFAAEYRGYGKSEGKPSGDGILSDAEGAYACARVRLGTDPRKLVIWGKSLGGAPAIHLAAAKPCAGLIVQSAFTSVPDMAKKVLPWFPAGAFIRTKLDNLSAIPRVPVPTLVIHSRKDEVVPYSHGVRLFEAVQAPKWFAEFDGVDHNELIGGRTSEWLDDLEGFLKKGGGL